MRACVHLLECRASALLDYCAPSFLTPSHIAPRLRLLRLPFPDSHSVISFVPNTALPQFHSRVLSCLVWAGSIGLRQPPAVRHSPPERPAASPRGCHNKAACKRDSNVILRHSRSTSRPRRCLSNAASSGHPTAWWCVCPWSASTGFPCDGVGVGTFPPSRSTFHLPHRQTTTE